MTGMMGGEEFQDFCSELRVRTKQVHDESDRLVNLKLVVVLTDVRLWAQTISEFYVIFRTLENCAAQLRTHPVIGGIHMGEACGAPKRSRKTSSSIWVKTGWSWSIRQRRRSRIAVDCRNWRGTIRYGLSPTIIRCTWGCWQAVRL